MEERYNLAIDRMKAIIEEKTVAEPYREYFQHVARFILKLDELKQNVESGKQKEMSEEELQEEMKDLYADELEANYEKSYANPAYAVSVLGGELGSFLSAVYTEIRGGISYVQEQRMEYVVIGAELLIEIYNKFEEEKQPQPESLKEIFYWYASDYCDVFLADRIREQILPEESFATDLIMNSDLKDLRYLYQFGEYISENEWKTAEHLNRLPEETIQKMADVYSEGYRIGFVNTGKDLSKKSVVNIRYILGFERVVKKAIENFEKMGLKPEDIVSVSIMPCTAKKFEIQRPDEAANGVPDVDYSLTTRELARMIRKVGLKFTTLPDEEFDAPLGLGTGAAVIFGATGGVMEAALRTAVETLTGEELQNLDFTDVRGMEGIKEATYPVAGLEVKVAIASGLGNARKLLEKVKSGEATYHFIEIMGCPGGCINGGGQPQQPGYVRNSVDIRGLRAKVLYDSDKNNPIRKSHENPAIKELYATFLGEPGSEKAHHLLHTTYIKRTVNEI